jgi:hypothetical protein
MKTRSDRRASAQKNARHLLEDGYGYSLVQGCQGKFQCNLPEDERLRRERLNGLGHNKTRYETSHSLDVELRDGLIHVQCDCRGFETDGDCKHAARLWMELKKAFPLILHIILPESGYGSIGDRLGELKQFQAQNFPL